LNRKPPTTFTIVLGLLVPGAGHWHAGAGSAGAAWFVVISIFTFFGTTLAGPAFAAAYQSKLAIGGMTIPIPLALPDAANFLESMFALKWYRDAHVDMPVPATAPYGYVLMAFGGVLNMIAASDASHRVRQAAAGSAGSAGRPPVIAALLAFLIPGAGHFYLGRRGKAILGGAALLLTFAAGVAMAHGTVVQRERDQYFWSGQILLGIPAAIATILDHRRRVQEVLPLAEMGLLFTTVAGLLNGLLILDAYATAERDIEQPQTQPADAATPPAPALS
jgi:TM2 domain-containing membrane protein YozV